jgi:hypothetical protein
MAEILSVQASIIAALSAMKLDDVRRLFPQDFMPFWIVMGKYEKVSSLRS